MRGEGRDAASMRGYAFSMAGMASLLRSRKFWIVVFTLAGMLVMIGTRQIDWPTFSKMAAALAGVLVLAIAHEDNGTKGGANGAPPNTQGPSSGGVP